jgi:uncharacterized protein (DUF488 family)
MPPAPETPTIFTIGHSNHPINTFIDMLKAAEIDAVADVRSVPYSKRHPQYRKDELAARLKGEGIAYVFLGKELGARPDDPDCYVDGRVVYDRIAATATFEEGLRRVEEGASRLRIALMCAEREPLDCHRTLLVSRHLIRRGVPIRHILADGAMESGEAVESRLATAMGLEEDDLFLDPVARIEEAYRLRSG